MSILVNIMEYIKDYCQNHIIFPSLTIIFGGFFTRKFYQNKELLKEIESEKVEIENIRKNEIDMLKYEIQQLKKENVKLTSENEKERIAALVNTALASDPESYKNTAALKSLITAIVGDIT